MDGFRGSGHPVDGGGPKRPHSDDMLVNALLRQYTGPDKLIGWVKVSLAQIHDSIIDDYHRTLQSRNGDNTPKRKQLLRRYPCCIE